MKRTVAKAGRLRLGAFKKSPDHLAAIQRVQAWTRERFNLTNENTVLVSEVSCGLPGCPPLETVVVFWTAADRRHQFKVFKPVAELIIDDLPPAWLRDALTASESDLPECC
jgi:nitrate reductase delta subunit